MLLIFDARQKIEPNFNLIGIFVWAAEDAAPGANWDP